MSSNTCNPSSKPIYFWRESETDYGVLSQWYERTFKVDGQRFATAEMWMMYQKAGLFDDQDAAERILKSTTPKQAQTIGRQVKGFDSKIWNQKKLQIVVDGNYWKFTSTPDMKAKLLGTGDRMLVEASPSDTIWGIGFDAAHADDNRADWGQNLLGQAIMSARLKIREEEDTL